MTDNIRTVRLVITAQLDPETVLGEGDVAKQVQELLEKKAIEGSLDQILNPETIKVTPEKESSWAGV